MGTMTTHFPTKTPISTLDVLWAFYLSQPKSIQKAFQIRLAAENKSSEIAQWQSDIKEIQALKANWDEEGAPKINSSAIRNTKKIMAMLTGEAAVHVRLYPTRLGAVMLKLETEKGRIKGEIGDKTMSYFIKRPGSATEHHSFEELTRESLSILVNNLDCIV